MKDSPTTTERKTYEKPTITVYFAAEVFSLIGPAVATYGNP